MAWTNTPVYFEAVRLVAVDASSFFDVEPRRNEESGGYRTGLRSAGADQKPELLEARERYSALARYAARKSGDHQVGLVLRPGSVDTTAAFSIACELGLSRPRPSRNIPGVEISYLNADTSFVDQRYYVRARFVVAWPPACGS